MMNKELIWSRIYFGVMFVWWAFAGYYSRHDIDTFYITALFGGICIAGFVLTFKRKKHEP